MRGKGLGLVMVTPVPGMNNQCMAGSSKESSGHREEVVRGAGSCGSSSDTHTCPCTGPQSGNESAWGGGTQQRGDRPFWRILMGLLGSSEVLKPTHK